MTIKVPTTPAAFKMLQELYYVMGTPLALKCAELTTMPYSAAWLAKQQLLQGSVSLENASITYFNFHTRDLNYCGVNQYNEAEVVRAAARFLVVLQREAVAED